MTDTYILVAKYFIKNQKFADIPILMLMKTLTVVVHLGSSCPRSKDMIHLFIPVQLLNTHSWILSHSSPFNYTMCTDYQVLHAFDQN